MKRSRTAQGVAAERAVLNAMGVLDDPYSKALLTPLWSGFAALMAYVPQRFRPGNITLTGLAARVMWYDAQVTEALRSGIKQVAVIGAGYDTRTWRFHHDDVAFFELDHPATQRDKRSRSVHPGQTYVEADPQRTFGQPTSDASRRTHHHAREDRVHNNTDTANRTNHGIRYSALNELNIATVRASTHTTIMTSPPRIARIDTDYSAPC